MQRSEAESAANDVWKREIAKEGEANEVKKHQATCVCVFVYVYVWRIRMANMKESTLQQRDWLNFLLSSINTKCQFGSSTFTHTHTYSDFYCLYFLDFLSFCKHIEIYGYFFFNFIFSVILCSECVFSLLSSHRYVIFSHSHYALFLLCCRIAFYSIRPVHFISFHSSFHFFLVYHFRLHLLARFYRIHATTITNETLYVLCNVHNIEYQRIKEGIVYSTWKCNNKKTHTRKKGKIIKRWTFVQNTHTHTHEPNLLAPIQEDTCMCVHNTAAAWK